jgi:hypothetical protein
MSTLRTGKHGTITHGNVSLKGTLVGFSFGSEFGPDRMTVEVDNGGGEVDFPPHWTWTEDPKPANVVRPGTIFRSLKGNGKYLVADISGSGKPTHWVNLRTGSLGAMQDYDFRAFADPENWEVVPNAG